jgi:hypothetical protein
MRTRVAAVLNFDGFGAGRGALHEGVCPAAGPRTPVPPAAPVTARSPLRRRADRRCHVVLALAALAAAALGSQAPFLPAAPVRERRRGPRLGRRVEPARRFPPHSPRRQSPEQEGDEALRRPHGGDSLTKLEARRRLAI